MTQACRSCGCTNFSACPGGCWWVEDDLCSACAVAVDVETGRSQAEADLPGWSANDAGILLPTPDLAGWSDPELRSAWGDR